MTRVDCAPKSNKDLCDRFSVSHFPQLLWGPPMKFASGSWDTKRVQNGIKFIDDILPADHLLNWINKQLGRSFNLDDKNYDPSQQTLSSNTSNAVEITQAIHDVEEATAFAFDVIIAHKMINRETQAPLIKFLQILVAHHPTKRCQRGSAELLMNFNELWPAFFSVNSLEASAIHDGDAWKSVDIFGKLFPREKWRFCLGSKNETRGFSCGLWVLFHSVSVRVGDGESQLTFTVICDFVHNFFLCDECRQHFYEMCSKMFVPVNTTRDLSLWLWSTHNKVNEMLKNEEKISGTSDPLFPKTTWPSKELCPSCYVTLSKKNDDTNNIDWNTNEVFSFLARYYGVILVSSYKEKPNKDIELTLDGASTNAITVPVGAALGIALASCAFGVLACLWRMHQKTRNKPKKRTGA